MMKSKLSLVLGTLLVGALALCARSAQSEFISTRIAPTFTVTEVVLPENSFPIGLNNANPPQVSGSYQDSDFFQHAFIWRNGQVTTIDAPGASDTQARGINDSGAVVVNAFLGQDTPATSYVASGGSFLQLQGEGQVIGEGINNAGEVSGFDGTENSQPATWTGGVRTRLDLDGFTSGTAIAINNPGHAAGLVGGDDGSAAAMWRDGALTTLTPTEQALQIALGINDHDQVVGVIDRIQHSQAFEWQNGTLTLLNSLGLDSLAGGINNLGVVAGYIGRGPSAHAAIWRHGVPADLNTLIPQNPKLQLTGAVAVNNRNQILARSSDFRWFLLTPTPQPDLVGTWSGLTLKTRGSRATGITGTLSITNQGTLRSGVTTATFFLSTDQQIGSGDTPLPTGAGFPFTLRIPALAPGATRELKFNFPFRVGIAPQLVTGKYLLAQIDPLNVVNEWDELNNVAVGGPL